MSHGFVLCAAAVAVAAGAARANAHPVPPAERGYVSTVAAILPNVLGLQATVLGGDDRLAVRNWSTKTVVILGYDGEPYLRFGGGGVFANVHSPATYLNRVRSGPVNVPAAASPRAKPLWRRVSAGTAYVWHDRRIRWTGKNQPRVVANAPAETHRVKDWRVPGRAGRTAFAITGFLGYVPPADAATTGGGFPTWRVAGALSVLLLAALAAVPLVQRRARRAV
jgi:hypothetical protein